MPWLRVEDDYPDHPKTLHLKELLRVEEADVYPMRLWRWTIKYAPGGDLSRFSNATLARGCNYGGDPNHFITALYLAGFLDMEDDESVLARSERSREAGERLVVHDWADYSGQYEVRTRKGRDKAQRHRNRLRAGDVTVKSPPEGKERKERKERRKEDQREASLRESSTRLSQVGKKAADSSTRPYPEFKDWAYERWREAGGEGAWSTADWACLYRGFRLLGDLQRAQESWGRYLQDASAFYQGHYPKKWSSEPARWLHVSGLQPKTAANIAAARAFISKETNS